MDRMNLTTSRKLEYISKLAERGTVISEVGSKKANVIFSPDEWVAMMKAELEAGSFKNVAEPESQELQEFIMMMDPVNNKIICSH